MNFLVRRVVWIGVAAGARYVFRRGAARTVDTQRERLAERLPTPVVSLAERLPGDPIRAGSSLVVAGKATKVAATGSQKATKRAADGFRVANQVRRRLAEAKDEVQSDFQTEVVGSVRSLRSQYLAITEGEDAATDALLDLRSDAAEPEELADVPEPVARGRRRRNPTAPEPKINRMQRSYLPPIKPWDRRR